MTRSTEPAAPDSSSDSQGPLDAAWRSSMHGRQEQALLGGECFISCPAPLDSGGLGRHMREILEAHERAGRRERHLASDSPGLPAADLAARARGVAAVPLGRVSRAWRMWARSVDFDQRAARAVPAQSAEILAFNGTAGAQFDAARRRGGSAVLSLVAANSHYHALMGRHELAHSQYPVERSWATRLAARNLREYGQAERILVASEYVRASFLEHGTPESSLVFFPLTPHPRYTPRAAGVPAAAPVSAPTRAEADTGTFEIVYVGSLTVHKGVPLLLDALGRLPHDDMRLTLVGGWGTRGMRRHVERAIAADPRISVSPGDPLPRFAQAHLCVHAAYEDGFGYAPAEALACGVPVIVSADTGMKDLIEEGVTGTVVPTGERDTLAEAIDAVYSGKMLNA